MNCIGFPSKCDCDLLQNAGLLLDNWMQKIIFFIMQNVKKPKKCDCIDQIAQQSGGIASSQQQRVLYEA
jgi:hypothetical protein